MKQAKGTCIFHGPVSALCHRLLLCRGVCGEKEQLLMGSCLLATAMAGSGVFTWTCASAMAAAKAGNGRDGERRVRDTPIDIPLTSAAETRRLSADEIQINCKAVR